MYHNRVMLATAFPVVNYNDLSQRTGCPVKWLHTIGNNSVCSVRVWKPDQKRPPPPASTASLFLLFRNCPVPSLGAKLSRVWADAPGSALHWTGCCHCWGTPGQQRQLWIWQQPHLVGEGGVGRQNSRAGVFSQRNEQSNTCPFCVLRLRIPSNFLGQYLMSCCLGLG